MNGDNGDLELSRLLARLTVEAPPMPDLPLPRQDPPRRSVPWALALLVPVVAAGAVFAWNPGAAAERLAVAVLWAAEHPGVLTLVATILSGLLGLGVARLGQALAGDVPEARRLEARPSPH